VGGPSAKNSEPARYMRGIGVGGPIVRKTPGGVWQIGIKVKMWPPKSIWAETEFGEKIEKAKISEKANSKIFAGFLFFKDSEIICIIISRIKI